MRTLQNPKTLVVLVTLLWPTNALAQRGPYPPGAYPMYVVDDRTASLRLDVRPREAEVFVDGYRVGKVDNFDGVFQRLHVRPGKHELVLFLEGYRTVRQHLDLDRFSSQKISETMIRLEPGEATGPRPSPVDPSAPAPNEPPRPGSRRPDRPSAERDARANEHFGSLSLRVLPADAEIFLDGERWIVPAGQDRIVIQLSDGKHRLEVRKTGFEPYAGEIQIKRGETTTLNVSLLKGENTERR